MVAREFVDESGRIADRPQFRKMIDEATNSYAPFREILAHSPPSHISKTVLSSMHVGGPKRTLCCELPVRGPNSRYCEMRVSTPILDNSPPGAVVECNVVC